MARENAKKSFRLSRKQFIIILAAVCGIALIIEGSLLIRMFAKKKENSAAAEKEKKPSLAGVVNEKTIPDSYICKVYWSKDDVNLGLDSINQVEYDSEGRLCHEYRWGLIYYQGHPYVVESSSDTYYFYDGQSRIVREEIHSKAYYPREDRVAKDERRTVSYEYKDGEAPEVRMETRDENGIILESAEERYNEQGVLIAHTEYEYINGVAFKTAEMTYNGRGDVVSDISYSIYDNGETKETESYRYSYYDSGAVKSALRESYDENHLVERMNAVDFCESGEVISWKYASGGEEVKNLYEYDEAERKSRKSDGTEENYVDEKGRMVLETYEDYSHYEKEFFYANQNSRAPYRITGKTEYKDGRKETTEYVFDSLGRIIRETKTDKDGTNTRSEYNWKYKDIRFSAKDVLQIKEYENGVLMKETLFLVEPDTEEKAYYPDSFFLNGGGVARYGLSTSGCMHYSNHNDKNDSLDSFRQINQDYVSPRVRYHLERYSEEVYDKDTATWNIIADATFDKNGGIKSIRYVDGIVHYLWDFDDHGNHIRTEISYYDSNNTIDSTYIQECEYTYYKGVSGETPEP